MTNAAIAYLCLVAAMSCVSFVAYGFDKRRATNGSRRVPEQTLHVLAFLGGWPGAFLGQRLFRHKTQKISFLIGFWATVVLHVALVGAIAYVVFDSSKAEASGRSQPTNEP